jgi:hypothetical protein
MFHRCIGRVPASYRTYSSFFSSKPGGGRYFNSARPPKSVIRPGSGANGGKVEPTTSSSSEPVDGVQEASSGLSGSSNNNVGGGKTAMKTKDERASLVQVPSSTVPDPMGAQREEERSFEATPSTPTGHDPVNPTPRISSHPTVSAHDYKLHQFFSLHRPLLLLSYPTSTIFETSHLPTSELFALSGTKAGSASALDPPLPSPAHLGTLDDPPEASPEADADAARQFARALVMNRVGGTIAWEDTLRRLGIDVDKDEGRIKLKERLDRELQEVRLDSTKRKRRKKMKKHKYVLFPSGTYPRRILMEHLLLL